MKINLHSHTQFCDGRATMEELLLAARQAGFATWGFSPHAPICVESPCNMKKEYVEDYLAEIKRLRGIFSDMKILAGMEVDFIDEEHGPASRDVAGYNLDFVIGSVHFIPNQRGGYFDVDGSPERFRRVLEEHFDNDLYYVVESFWRQTQRMISAGGFDIIGHIDKIALNASFVDPAIEYSDLYKELADETIEMAIVSGKKIEINTKHFEKYGRFFPHPRYWRRIIGSGIEMPVNSDAHYADKIESGMKEAYEILNQVKSYKYNSTRSFK